jgi:hypothetical protein
MAGLEERQEEFIPLGCSQFEGNGLLPAPSLPEEVLLLRMIAGS